MNAIQDDMAFSESVSREGREYSLSIRECLELAEERRYLLNTGTELVRLPAHLMLAFCRADEDATIMNARIAGRPATTQAEYHEGRLYRLSFTNFWREIDSERLNARLQEYIDVITGLRGDPDGMQEADFAALPADGTTNVAVWNPDERGVQYRIELRPAAGEGGGFEVALVAEWVPGVQARAESRTFTPDIEQTINDFRP